MVRRAGEDDWQDMGWILGEKGKPWRESLRDQFDSQCQTSEAILPERSPGYQDVLMCYTLLNVRTGKTLQHPLVGLWFTTDLVEAKAMLVACLEYLDATGLSELHSDFCIVNAVTNQPVACSDSTCSLLRVAD